jgi:signal transduction histidine kinase
MNKVKGSFLVKALVHLVLFLLGLTLLIGMYNIFSYLDSYSTNTKTFLESSDFQSKYLKYVERVAVYVDYREKGYSSSVSADSSIDLSTLFEKEEATPDLSRKSSGQEDFNYYNAIVNNVSTNFIYYVKNLETGKIYCSPSLEKRVKESSKDKNASMDSYLKSVQANAAYLIINTATQKYVTNVNRNYQFINDENLSWVIDYITGATSTLDNSAKGKRADYIVCTSILSGFPNRNDEFGIMNAHFNELHDNFMISLFPVPASFVLLLLFFVLAVTLSGHKKSVDGISITMFDKLPSEAGLFLVLLGIFSLLSLGYYVSKILYFDFHLKMYYILAFDYILLYPFCMFGLMSLVRRCKANIIFQNSYLWTGCKKFAIFIRDFFAERSITYRVAILLLIFIGIQFLAFNVFYRPISNNIKQLLEISIDKSLNIKDIINRVYIINNSNIHLKRNLMMFILVIILDYMYLGYVLFKVAIDYNILRKETKKLTEGDLNHKIPISNMCSPARTLGEYINNIGDGFSAAVDEKLKSERLKTELITNVSHDIKTPLTSIINYVDLLKKENLQNETASEYLEVLSVKSWRLKTLIEDLVEASKASSGTLPMNLECLNLVELVRQSIGEFEDRLTSHNLETVLNIQEEPVYIMADGRSTYRIIENIFSNANKYALSGTRIYVDITTEENMVMVSVT